MKRGRTVGGVGGLGEKGKNIPGRRARGKAYANGFLYALMCTNRIILFEMKTY